MLPVINSTFSPDHLASFVQQQYQLGDDASCTLLKTGINDSFLITDNGVKYVFRVYSLNWRTRQEILAELTLLNLLQTNQIPVSYAIKNIQGEYVLQLEAPEGTRFGVLFSFAKGEKMLNFPAELHFQAGEIMAKMHLLTDGLQLERLNYSPNVILQDSFEQLKKFLPANTAEMDFMVSTQKYLLDEYEKFDGSKLRKGAVHMDIWFDNMGIDKETGITLFDFDFCGNGWLCYDVAYYILQLNSTEKDDAECKLKTEAFLNGYASVMPLTAEEKRIIPHLGVALYFFYLGIQCQRFDNWSNTFLNETYLKRFINLLVKRYFEKNGLG
jgi:Ser/Thr protein kinase RdoA (MazF antagonist)